MKFENPGATPSVSANGPKDAIVWAIATKTWNGQDRPAVLYAFDATKINQPINSSEENSKRDRGGLATRFVIPVVVNGRVYVWRKGRSRRIRAAEIVFAVVDLVTLGEREHRHYSWAPQGGPYQAFPHCRYVLSTDRG
jgi:hypothetical protein